METSPLNNDAHGLLYTRAASSSIDTESPFICNVCLDITTKDPVVTQCGHLYCWPCLYRWLNTRHATCPVCKAAVTKENVIPLFIRGNEQDPRASSSSAGVSTDVPSRPAARRPDPHAASDGTPLLSNNNNAEYGSITQTGAMGYFPSLFGLQFQPFPYPFPVNTDSAVQTEDQTQERNISKFIIFSSLVALLTLLLL